MVDFTFGSLWAYHQPKVGRYLQDSHTLNVLICKWLFSCSQKTSRLEIKTIQVWILVLALPVIVADTSHLISIC